jgi:uncharacterized RDD family membrane protein YckC
MSILGLSITDTTPNVQGAGFWIRVLARIIDFGAGYLMGFVVGILGYIVLSILQRFAVIEPGWPWKINEGRALLVLASLVGSVLYEIAGEGLSGATLGKVTCGLRVISEDFSPCSVKQAFIRSVAYFFDGLIFGAVGYMEMTKTPREQRHGDRWAKTLVVKSSQVPEPLKSSGSRVAGAIILGSLLWMLSLLVTYVILGFAG